ncbi:MAG: type II toxin-antitoxin system HicA family toxin [Candidatus Atribacteria bacterium]|nr:type II toxin-antitoxin system HicA family toxin [Candidatus Atribacteria bacterium]
MTIPIHNKDLKPETLKSILRQAKISIEELEFNR